VQGILLNIENQSRLIHAHYICRHTPILTSAPKSATPVHACGEGTRPRGPHPLHPQSFGHATPPIGLCSGTEESCAGSKEPWLVERVAAGRFANEMPEVWSIFNKTAAMSPDRDAMNWFASCSYNFM
jgi:hypothetical protein